MTELINDNLLKALQKEPVPYTPIWLMRQAGRFLPEYRATREKAGSFLNLAHSPEYATEVTLQPVDRFDLDAAILFSDILTVPDAMGLGLKFVPGEWPVFESPVQSEEAVVKLHVPDVGTDLKYVTDAVSSIRSALQGRVPLFGFSGSPFTLACYMIEGRGSRNFFTVKSMMYRRPDLFQKVISVNEKAVTEYLNAQIEAGAQAIQIFDTWGGCLADGLYQQYSLASIRNVIANLTREHEGRRVPVVVFTKGGSVWLKDIASCGADAVGLDWTMNLARAREEVKDRVALQGNLDPAVLLSDEKTVREEARLVLDAYGPVGQGGHVFNLGHGVDLNTPVELVHALVDEVHHYSRQYHI